MSESRTDPSASKDRLELISTEVELVEPSAQTALDLGRAHESKRDPYRLVGVTLGNRYRLVEYAGGGGMGAVYRCYDTDSAQAFALKILKPDIVVNYPIYAELFEREVEAAQKLSHPHIVKLFASGIDDSVSFMVMEWLDGRTLEDALQDGRLELARVVDIFSQVCSAFAEAHDKGIIHLDIKPANIILVNRGQPKDFIKVIDFGLARVLKSDSGTTVTRFLGTYQYCSPEHFGGKLTHRSDIYSLGVVLYNLLTGLLPFRASHIQAKMNPGLEMPAIPSLLSVRPDLPMAIENVIFKALSRNPNDRQQSVHQLSDEFLTAIRLLPASRASAALALNDQTSDLTKSRSLSVALSATMQSRLSGKSDRSQRYLQIVGILAFISALAIVAVVSVTRPQLPRLSSTDGIGTEEVPPSREDTPSENTPTGLWGLTKTLIGHEKLVWSVAFSPDGNTLASSSQDTTVRLWDVRSGALKRILPIYYKGADLVSDNVVAFSKDGQLLASGNYDRIVIWDVPSGGLRALLPGHQGNVNCVAFSADGKKLASASQDHTVILWDLQNEKPIRTMLVCPGECLAHGANSVTFSPDGRTLATGDSNHDVKLWDAETGLIKQQLTGHGATVWTVAFSPDGKTLASASGDATIRLWDVSTGALKHTLVGHNHQVWSVAFSPDGSLLASGSFDETMKLWSPRTGTLKQTLAGHSDAIHGIAFSPDGRTLASASNDKTVKLWRVTEEK